MRVVAVALAVAMLALSSLGTGRGGDAMETAQAPTLNVGAISQMVTRNVLTPLAWQDPYTMAVLARVYDTAVQRDPTTDAVVPVLAVGIDQDGDGILDLVFHFETQQTGIDAGDTQACLTGKLFDSTSITSCDSIKTI